MRRTLIRALATAAVLLGPAGAQAQSVTTLDPKFKVTGLRAEGARAIAVGEKAAASIEPTARGATAKPANLTRASFRPKDMIPHAIVAGSVRIAIAYFAGPTDRYRHGALGDAIEAERLVLRDTAGGTAVIEAGPDAVFEDLQPRIVDLDGDGFPEVIAVKAYLDRGAALAVIGRRDGKWGVIAETPPIGTANRWLNPAGAADFDGDGTMDVALVRTPHIAGVLEFWTLRGGALVKLGEKAGYSNHANGSTVLALAATADFDGDGAADLAIPSLDRKSLRFVRFKGGVFAEMGMAALPARALTGVVVIGEGAGRRVVVGLENGKLAVVTPPRPGLAQAR